MAAAAVIRLAEGYDWRVRFADPAARLVAVAALLYGAWSVIALSFSLAPWPSLFGIPSRGQGAITILAYVAVFLAVALFLRERAQARRLVSAMILGSVPVAGLGLLEAIGIEPFPPLDPMLKAFPVRSTLGQHSFLGAYLILVMPFTAARLLEPLEDRVEGRAAPAALALRTGALIAFWAVLVTAAVRGAVALWWAVVPSALLLPRAMLGAGRLPRGLARAAFGGLLVLQVLALAASQGRGPWLGLAAGLFVALVLALWLVARRRRWLAAAMAAFVAATLTVLLLNVPEGPLAPLKAWHPLVARLGALGEVEAGSPGGVRLAIWRSIPVGFGLVAGGPPHAGWSRLVVGYGPDGQLGMMPFVLSGPLADVRHADTTGREISFDIDRAHNDLLDHLITQGLVGLALFITLFAGALWAAFRLLRSGRDQLWAGAAATALIAHAVELQTGVAITASRVLFWLVTGLMLASLRLPETSPGGGARGAARDRESVWVPLVTAGAGVVALLAASLLAPGEAVLPMVVMTCWVLLELGGLARICAPASGGAARGLSPWAAAGAIAAAALVIVVTGMNFLGAVHFGTGREYALRAQWEPAIVEYQAAVGLAPWEDSYWQALGEVYARAGFARATRGDRGRLLARGGEALETARALNRASVRARRNLARLYSRAGPTLAPDALSRADAVYREASALRPRDAGLLAERAEVALRRGVPAEARELASAATALDPSLWSAHAIKARVALEAGNLEEARAAAAEASARVADSDRPRLQRFLQGLP